MGSKGAAMSIKETIEILMQYNLWRRDDNVPNSYEMPDPKKVGLAIDKAIESMQQIDKFMNQDGGIWI